MGVKRKETETTPVNEKKERRNQADLQRFSGPPIPAKTLPWSAQTPGPQLPAGCRMDGPVANASLSGPVGPCCLVKRTAVAADGS